MMDRTILVTGASRGIGRATARRFALAGDRVIVNYCASRQMALELVAQLEQEGCRAMAIGADVSDAAQVRAMLNRARGRYGEIDVLVNNAGIAQQKLFTDLTDEDWNRMFDVNVKGVFHCSREVLPAMISSRSGSIINVSSIWGISGASCEVHYSAAKAAVIGLTKALAKEVGPSGVRVNCVAPGVVKTEMIGELDEQTLAALTDAAPLGMLGEAEDIADAIFYLASEGARFITGQVLSPNGGFVI